MIEVKVDIEGALRYLQDFERNLIPKATSAAINKVATSARAEAVRQIAHEANLTQAEVRQRIDIRASNRNTLEATITARPWSPNLIRYNARQAKAGVVASPWRKRRVHRHTFIANKGRTVFVRTSRNRLPIKSVRGPSVRKEFMRGYAINAMRRKIDERFAIEFERAMRQFMRTR